MIKQNKRRPAQINLDERVLQRTVDAVRTKCNSELPIIASEALKLQQVRDSIERLVYKSSPEYMIILIEKRPEIQKYHTTIYSSG